MFVIDLAAGRVQILGSTPFLNDLSVRQVCRTLTAADDEWRVPHRVLICDRDAKWSAPVRTRLRGGDSRGADAVSGTQCECLRRTVRAIDQRGVPRSANSTRRAPFPRIGKLRLLTE
jgi:hypothetical protein